jgi:phage shock protein A
MSAMTLDQILDRVQELKDENAEKDDAIRVQQLQIDELEKKVQDLLAQIADLEDRISSLTDAAGKADELVEKLSQVLG